MRDETFRRLGAFVALCIRQRVRVLFILGLLTAVFAVLASGVPVRTEFSDLLPADHPYVQVNDRYKGGFGSSNMVSIMLEVEDGDIFRPEVLKTLHVLTRDLQKVDGVDPFQIVSLASKKLKEVRTSTEGIEIRPLMWPDVPADEAGIAALKLAVLNNPMAYGPYVSADLKAALVTVDFYDHLLDYHAVFEQICALVRQAEGPGIALSVVGEPMLYGWVDHYLPETLHIFLMTLGALVALLFLITRSWRGTLLPLTAGAVSAVWALGCARLIGYHFDPLVIVVAFLITARAISHSVQLVTRFDDEIARHPDRVDAAVAARTAMLALFKPGMLGVVADAGCMIVVILTPIPLLQKVAVIGTVWVATIAVSAVVLTPVLLSYVRRADAVAHPVDVSPMLARGLDRCVRLAAAPRVRRAVLASSAVVFAASLGYAFSIKVGDANPGSPILWGDSEYNRDAARINDRFPGADRMFVVAATGRQDGLKNPLVLQNMAGLQRFMEAQPDVGGTISLADIVPTVKRTLREGSPRYEEFGATPEENGELLYLFTSGADPGDLERYADNGFADGAVTLFFRDHQGETIRTAVARVKEYAAAHPLPGGGEYLLAGGLVGVLAAVNEVILAGQIESIALALLVLVVCCTVTYRSTVAGMFFMVPVVISNTLTFSYMAWKGIGMNINTLPIAALGIGLGVDYAFYIVDGIREELHKHRDLDRAIAQSLRSAGKGVLITALTLTASVILWAASSLRFQAEMGLLMALWLGISACCALFVMPAMVRMFRPRFIVGDISDPVSQQVPAMA
ncbi:MMPL family transporter [Azoarcus sp. L1K30]|uniref:efflux RND transporter permease subunit n=1 Tax=Azoarcus sp. L1K30 TaxID=2820277 RepID=UPI001B83EADB|nr:efflux RND transporter permease subunit [Azoarcus sp. L1K30]MBR0567506.1 MMPL family transporter [Azoarcus sp. L1K30]